MSDHWSSHIDTGSGTVLWVKVTIWGPSHTAAFTASLSRHTCLLRLVLGLGVAGFTPAHPPAIPLSWDLLAPCWVLLTISSSKTLPSLQGNVSPLLTFPLLFLLFSLQPVWPICSSPNILTSQVYLCSCCPTFPEHPPPSPPPPSSSLESPCPQSSDLQLTYQCTCPLSLPYSEKGWPF